MSESKAIINYPWNTIDDLVKVIAGNSKNIDLSYNGELVMLDKLTNKNLVSCVVLPAGECSEFRTPNN